MRRRPEFIAIVCILLGLALPAMAQQPNAQQPDTLRQEAFVTLSTNLPTATVYADTLRLGVAAQEAFHVPDGTTTLRLVPAEGDGWSITPQERAIRARPGDTLTVRIDFPYHYKIETIPFGAPVYLDAPEGRRLLGTTPLTHRSDVPLKDDLVVDLKGYQIETVAPGQDVWNRHVLTLDPAQPSPTEAAGPEVDWQPPKKRRVWIDVAAASIAVAAGVYSVHQKFRGDALYEEYEDTRDPALRSRVEAYDTRALVGLGVMQVGLGVLTVRLIRR